MGRQAVDLGVSQTERGTGGVGVVQVDSQCRRQRTLITLGVHRRQGGAGSLLPRRRPSQPDRTTRGTSIQRTRRRLAAVSYAQRGGGGERGEREVPVEPHLGIEKAAPLAGAGGQGGRHAKLEAILANIGQQSW